VADRPFRVGKADQRRDILTGEQIKRVIRAHAPMMQRAGYLLPNSGADIMPSAQAPLPAVCWDVSAMPMLGF
jgi:hypothetical protein